MRPEKKELLVHVLLPLFLMMTLAYANTRVFEGVARYEGQFAYIERHTEVYNENDDILSSLTVYFDEDGKVIGKLRHHFAESREIPSLVMNDYRSESRHGLRYDEDKIILFNKVKGFPVERGFFDSSRLIEGQWLAGQGLHFFIVNNLEELIKKEEFVFKLLLPPIQEGRVFLLEVVSVDEGEVKIEIRAANWFWKTFGPRLSLVYDREHKRLLHYSGFSNLKSEEGDMMMVDIKYYY
jgi:hypothetical protein